MEINATWVAVLKPLTLYCVMWSIRSILAEEIEDLVGKQEFQFFLLFFWKIKPFHIDVMCVGYSVQVDGSSYPLLPDFYMSIHPSKYSKFSTILCGSQTFSDPQTLCESSVLSWSSFICWFVCLFVWYRKINCSFLHCPTMHRMFI